MSKMSFPILEIGVAEVLKELISDNIEEITAAISFSQQDMNDRVEIGDVTVDEVRIQKDGAVEIDFRYEWSYFSGCKNIKKQGLEVETVHARIVETSLVFDIAERPEPRTTVDEF